MQTISIADKNLIRKVSDVLINGGIVIYPTETCYGVGADATNLDAVKRLLEYKRRPEGKAISIAVSDIEMAKRYVNINDVALNIYKNFLPGPVTVISNLKKNKNQISKGLASENGTLGVRIPKYETILKVIKSLNKPITATSANSNGTKTPYSIQDIFDNLTSKQKSLIDLIIDAGELPHNPPSTVVDTTKDEMKTLREGSVSFKNKILEVESNSELETNKIAKDFINSFKNFLKTNCILILFNAEMGAGKTIFVKALGKELGIKEIITSPTYNLVEEYKAPYGKLVHLDAWRIESFEEFEKLKLDQYLKPNNIVAVEWAGEVSNSIRKKYLVEEKNVVVVGIDIEYKAETKRKITITRN